MASSSLFIFIPFAFACFALIQADLISDVCRYSNNPAFCNTVIRSDSRSKGGDLATIGNIAVDKAKVSCNQVITIAKLVRNSKNTRIVDDCVELSRLAIENLDVCRKLLPPQNPFEVETLGTRATAFMSDIDTCVDGFDERKVGEPEKLKEVTRRASDLGSILLSVAHSFPGNRR